MKVRVLHTKAFDLTNNSDLIAKIKRDGKEVKAGAWPYGSTVKVNDMFFMLGGRNSIENVLKTVRGGKFTGSQLVVKTQTEAKAFKKYTIICVCIWSYAGRFGQTEEAWGTMFNPSTPEVLFSDITSKLWDNEKKIVGDIVEYSGL